MFSSCMYITLIRKKTIWEGKWNLIQKYIICFSIILNCESALTLGYCKLKFSIQSSAIHLLSTFFCRDYQTTKKYFAQQEIWEKITECI